MTELSQATSSVNVVTEHTVMPQDFATREVGTILTVLPEVSPEDTAHKLADPQQ